MKFPTVTPSGAFYIRGNNDFSYFVFRKGEDIMTLSAPKQLTFIIAVVLAVVGLLAAIVPLGPLTGLSLWIILIGFVVLAAGCLLADL